MYNIKGLRAVTLLRVSSEKQTDDKEDIPFQRELVNEFIKRKELVFIREFVEPGISAFRTKMSKRDKIIEIKQMARNNEFDVLVVYKSDRIGRTSDESPLVVRYLNEKGIRIFTTNGNEIKTKTQYDKLVTYIDFWQNETESVKLSERAIDYHTILVKNGNYRGGFVPYGYKLANNGTQNHKGRYVYDFEINHEEAEIIRLIYNLSIRHNMGARAIAKYLNENGYKAKSNNGDGWAFTTINYILKNPIYKGSFHMHIKTKNEFIISSEQKDVVIIPEETWELNQQIMKNRRTYSNNKMEGITRGSGLLSGIVYCGHCGNKMHMWNNHKYYYRKKGEKVKIIKASYRCRSALSGGCILCKGQKTYSTNKIDSIVEEETLSFVIQLQNKKLEDKFKKDLTELYSRILNVKKEKDKLLQDKQKQLFILKKEIPNALIGNSTFTAEELKESINIIQNEINNITLEANNLNAKLNQAKLDINEYENMNSDLNSWIEKYKNSDANIKKALLSDVIERVIIKKDEVEIVFNVKWTTFKENCEVG